MAAMALSLASCGGGSDDPAEREGPQIPKAQLIERADAICQRDRIRLAALLANLPAPNRSAGLGAIAPFLELNEKTIRSGAQRIEALGRPSSDGRLLDDYLDERTTAANAIHAAVAAARKGDDAQFDAALEAYGRNAAFAAAKKFGFQSCDVGAGRLSGRTAGGSAQTG
jgi:hypothetical protein